MKTLEELREEESRKYPDLKVSLWHIKDVRSLTYTDAENRALTVFLTPELKMESIKYKPFRYEKGPGVDYRVAENVPDWTNDIFNDYRMSSIKENSIGGMTVSLSGFGGYTNSEHETR